VPPAKSERCVTERYRKAPRATRRKGWEDLRE
jgi:hypothetical protein